MVARIFAVGLAAVVALTWLPNTANAEWDPTSFSRHLERADKAFVAEEWTDALTNYERAKNKLDESLAHDEIPVEQLGRAKLALSTIEYQIARTLERSGRCAVAAAAYKELVDMANVQSSVRVKLDARLAETLLCVAVQRLEAGDTAAAGAALSRARTRLDTIDEARLATLGEEAEGVREDMRVGVINAAEAIGTYAGSECAMLRDVASMANASIAQVTDPHAFSDVRRAAAECRDKETSAVETESGWPSVGPIVTIGAGALLLTGFLVAEIAISSEVSEYEDAERSCIRGNASDCPRSLVLADEIETNSTVSASLLALGLATTGGGLVWYWMESAPEPRAGVGFSFEPRRDGGLVWASWHQ